MNEDRGAVAAPSRALAVAALAAGVFGFAAGVVIDLVSPNVVYGAQIIGGALAILAVGLALLLRRLHRLLLPAIVAGALGLVAGIVAGFALLDAPSPFVTGTAEVNLTAPSARHSSIEVTCRIEDGTLLSLTTPALPTSLPVDGGQWLVISVGAGDYAPPGAVPGAGGLAIEVLVGPPDDGSGEPRLLSAQGSMLERSGTAAQGLLTFAGLGPDGDGPAPSFDVAGSIAWTCAHP